MLAGQVECSAPLCMVEQAGGTRRIAPTAEWDLGHDETDRRRYAGPQHQECNRGQSRRITRHPTPAIDPAAPFDADAWS